MKLSPSMKRMIRQIGDAWLLDGNTKRTMNALVDRGLVERISTYERRGTLFTRKGVEVYWKLTEENDE